MINKENCKEWWNNKAKDNPLYWIISNENSKSEDKFFATGIDSYNLITKDINIKQNMDVLEVGCGVGRITFQFAKYCNIVNGVDICSEYIRLANEYKNRFKVSNIDFYENDGENFDIFNNNQFDFVYSYIVFQHIPYEETLINNIINIHRVLKINGIFKFHHNRLSQQSEGDIGFGCSLSQSSVNNILKVGYELVNTYPDESYAQYKRGWWTILKKI